MKLSRIIHFEVPVDNIERAAEFFKNVFGWKLNNRKGPWGTYHSIKTGSNNAPGIDGAFFMKRTVPPNFARVINSIVVDDIDASMELISKHGGKIAFGKISYADIGQMAYFMDPEGNILGVIEKMK